MSSGVALLQLRNSSASVALAALGAARQQNVGRIVVSISSETITKSVLDVLGYLYGDLAKDAPRYDMVSKVERSGKTGRTVPLDAIVFKVTGADATSVTILRSIGDQNCLTLHVPLRIPSEDLVLAGTRLEGESLEESRPLTFASVALGGTFDRLHAGHRLLLGVAAAITDKTVYIGVTDQKLLEAKKFREIIQPYEERSRVVKDFVQEANPQIHTQMMQLVDPKVPTRAETDHDVQAIVVSEETVPGAHKINSGRLARGFAELTIVVVPMIGALGFEADKLSSTRLRAEDARKG